MVGISEGVHRTLILAKPFCALAWTAHLPLVSYRTSSSRRPLLKCRSTTDNISSGVFRINICILPVTIAEMQLTTQK